MPTMDSRVCWGDFLRAFASVPTTQEELATKQPSAALVSLSGIGEQIASAAQAVSQFLEPLLSPRPDIVERVFELVMVMKAFDDVVQEKGGDKEAVFRALALHDLEREPDPLLITRLRQDLRRDDFDEMPLDDFWDLLDHHKVRLIRDSELERVQRETAAIRQGIKKYASVDAALDALALEGQTHDEVLEEMIPGVAYIEEAEMPPSDNLSGRVASRICREGLEQPHDPGKVSTTDLELLLECVAKRVDEIEVATFADRELLACKIQDADLSPQELESFVFGVLYGDKKAGVRLGRPANQVAQEKLRATKKLHQSA